jgi:hypothetical protein
MQSQHFTIKFNATLLVVFYDTEVFIRRLHNFTNNPQSHKTVPLESFT